MALSIMISGADAELRFQLDGNSLVASIDAFEMPGSPAVTISHGDLKQLITQLTELEKVIATTGQ